MLVLTFGWVMIIAYQRGILSPWLHEWSRFSHSLLMDSPTPFLMVILKCPLSTDGLSSLVVIIAVIVLYSLENHDRPDLSELCTNYICMKTLKLPRTFHISSAFFIKRTSSEFFPFELFFPCMIFFLFVGK